MVIAFTCTLDLLAVLRAIRIEYSDFHFGFPFDGKEVAFNRIVSVPKQHIFNLI